MTLQAKDYIDRGRELLAEKRYPEAYEEFSKAAYVNSTFVEAFEGCGDAAFAMGNFEEAQRNYRRALPLDPGNAELHASYARALAKAERPDFGEVAEEFRLATEHDPHNAKYFYEWGDALYSKRDFAGAAKQFGQVVSLQPDYPEAYHSWGQCFVELRDYEPALEKYEAAAGVGTDGKLFYRNWGYVLKMLRRYEEAEKKFARAVKLDPTFYAARNGLGTVYDKLYKDAEAVAEFEEAAKGEPPVSIFARNNWGNVLLRMRRYGEAVEQYDKAIELASGYSKAYYNKASAYWRQGVYKEARKVWRQVLGVYESKPKASMTPDDYQLYGDVLYKVERDAWRANAMYREAIALQPDNVDVMLDLIALCVEQKKDAHDAVERNALQTEAEKVSAEAERALAKFLKKMPDDVGVRLAHARLYLTMGRYEKARDDYLDAAKKLERMGHYMELATVYSELGMIYANTDDFKQAAQYFAKSLEQNPDDLTTRSHLGEAYCKLGESEKSERTYTELFSTTLGHVEAYVGMGELYRTMGDAGEADMYDQAVSMYDEAIKLSRSRCGSKVLSNKELAAVLYARGYAKVKLYEEMKQAPDEHLLREALADFRLCFRKDRCHLKAKRAQQKLTIRLGVTRPQQIFKFAGPVIIFALSLAVFGYAQYLVFTGKPSFWNAESKTPESLSGEIYSLLTFGSLIFMVAGLSLPQLLKLKIAGVELEKSSVDQIQPSGKIGIKD